MCSSDLTTWGRSLRSSTPSRAGDVSEPVTVALCGAGMIARAHAMAAGSVGARVVAVASRSPESATKLATEIGSRVVDYDRLPAGADIVVVATPPGAHFDHTAHALERGAAVLLEKPMVLTLNEADRLVIRTLI